MLVRTIYKRKAVDEFEIKQVFRNRNINEGNSSRSLVFKISKRTNKTSKQLDIPADHKVTLKHSTLGKERDHTCPLISEQRLSPEPRLTDNFKIKHLIKTGATGDFLSTVRHVKPEPVLRRTSKRLVLRVRKQNLEVIDKTSADKKLKDRSSKKSKQGLNYRKMARRKGGRKALSTAQPKPEIVRRGRGRPRTVNRDQEKGKKISMKGSEPTKQSLEVANHADNSSVWALVPKEVANSDYFKSHFLKTCKRGPRGRRPKKILTESHIKEMTQLALTKDMKIQFPSIPPTLTKPVVQQQTLPLQSRPTVIYCKSSKNSFGEMEKNTPVLNQINFSGQQVQSISPEELQLMTINNARQNLGSVANDVPFHGFSQAMCHRKQPTLDCCTSSNDQYGLSAHLQQEINVGPWKEFVLQTNGLGGFLEPPPVESRAYISCRQVIVDAIRTLYDEESVIGNA